MDRPGIRPEAVDPLSSVPSAIVTVCSLELLPFTLSAVRATHLVSVIDPATLPDTPPSIIPSRHLRLGLNDIVRPTDGYVHPAPEHIEDLIRFADAWAHGGPLLIHCWAGVSRSTAAAFIALCTVNEPGAELTIAAALRHASPTANPNALMVRIADDVLGRRGRMVDALEAIGCGALERSAPFSLPSRFTPANGE